MTLLDVIVPGEPYRPRIRRHFDDTIVSNVNPSKAVDSVANLPADSMQAVDSACCVPANTDAVADSVNSSQLAPSLLDQLGGGDDSSILLWAIVAVIFALAVCLYFVLTYRRMLAANRKG